MSIPVAVRSKVSVCGLFPAGIVGSNPAGGMDVSFLWVLCLVRYSFQRRADHSSSEVLQIVVCLTECDREASTVRRSWTTSEFCAMDKK